MRDIPISFLRGINGDLATCFSHGLMLAALAFAPPTQAQSGGTQPDPLKAVMDALMEGRDPPGNLPSAGLTNGPMGGGVLATMARMKTQLRTMIDQHGEESPQAVLARKALADYQDNYANNLFAIGFYRDAFPMYVEVQEERERRTGVDSADSAASRRNVEKTRERLKAQTPSTK